MAILAWSGTAGAMSIRTNVSLLAFSRSGESFLLQVSKDGPEGGGSLGYALYDVRRRTVAVFTISSDFSPGDGSTPQRIHAGSCQAAAGKLRRLLAQKKYPGVSVRPGRCAGKRRWNVVEVSARTRRLLQASAFSHEKGTGGLVKGPLVVGTHRKKLGLWTRKAAPGSSTSGLSGAFLAPWGKAVVTLLSSPSGHDTRLGPVWRSPAGKPGEFKRVLLPSRTKR